MKNRIMRPPLTRRPLKSRLSTGRDLGQSIAVMALTFLASRRRPARKVPFDHRTWPAQSPKGGGGAGILQFGPRIICADEPLLLAFAAEGGPGARAGRAGPRGPRRPPACERSVMAAGARKLCRDCLATFSGEVERCPGCGSPRGVDLEAPAGLTIAHVDCDAFYASVEKRDDPEPPGQAGDRRRLWAARRRGDMLLCRSNLWRPFGDANGTGAGALPRGRGAGAGHGEIFARRPGNSRPDADADAACRAAFDRRGLSRPHRMRGSQRRGRGGDAGPVCSPRGRRNRGHGLGRPQRLQVSGQARLRRSTSPAASPLCAGRRRQPGLRRRASGACGGSARPGGSGWSVWVSGRSAICRRSTSGKRPPASETTAADFGDWRRASISGA